MAEGARLAAPPHTRMPARCPGPALPAPRIWAWQRVNWAGVPIASATPPALQPRSRGRSPALQRVRRPALDAARWRRAPGLRRLAPYLIERDRRGSMHAGAG